jgi:hypothetical protein
MPETAVYMGAAILRGYVTRARRPLYLNIFTVLINKQRYAKATHGRPGHTWPTPEVGGGGVGMGGRGGGGRGEGGGSPGVPGHYLV